ncbi:MAG TPA: Crp/Fnr family transcriptional regulator [Acidisphaera sp.]|nr:Crp/Fnr family transcriptional regulator [Acidisphaera sp.]
MAKLDDKAKRAALLSSTLFQAMSPDEITAILSIATDRVVPRGTVIFQKGDPGSSLMAVLKGRVRISTVSPDGKELTLNTIRAGEVFGEIALLDGKPRSADATAVEETHLLVLERKAFMPLLRGNEDLLLRLLGTLCERLRRTSLALEEIALFDLPARLARVLVKLGQDYGRPGPEGVRIDVRLSQRDLSTLVASSRESVNKQLRHWRDDGVVSMDGGYLVLRRVRDLEALVA